MSILGTLLFAWFLTLFDLDTILVGAVNELFGTNYSNNLYWFIAFIIAVIGTAIEVLIRRHSRRN